MNDSALSMVVAPELRVAGGRRSARRTPDARLSCPAGLSRLFCRVSCGRLAALAALALAFLADLGAGALAQSRFQWPALPQWRQLPSEDCHGRSAWVSPGGRPSVTAVLRGSCQGVRLLRGVAPGAGESVAEDVVASVFGFCLT